MNANDNIALIEDHHEALRIWREKKIKNLDLVHIDAHLDFGFHTAKPIKQVVDEAKSVKDLKVSLEQSLAFTRYEKDFEKQTNIGNYIYPAMREGIVKNFYWVIPGGVEEFKKSHKYLRTLIKNLTKQDPYRLDYRLQITDYKSGEGLIITSLLGKKFVICILDKLPILRQKLLLDIDTDFLIIDNLKNADSILMIGKRKPWIMPDELISILHKKIKNPAYITIAYSVNGGFTPMKYKHLGDEIAYRFLPQHFQKRFHRFSKAAKYFDLFSSTGEREYYQKAIKLNPTYRKADNSYGPLYLGLRKFSKAEEEFRKVIRADLENPYSFIGLGNIFLQRKDYHRSKKYFRWALKQNKDLTQGIFGLAQAEFRLKNLDKAKKLFLKYQKVESMQPRSYYFLGRINEEEKDFEKAVEKYQDAARFGLNNIDILTRLLKISKYIEAKDEIIEYIIAKYKEIKKRFARIKRLGLKKGKKVKGLRKMEEKIVALNKNLQKIKKERG